MDKKTWNNYVKELAPPFGAFLQSWEWGEFQKALGRKVERIYSSTQEGDLLAQAVRMDLPLGQYYWQVPKGPIGTLSQEKALEVLRQHLEGAVFLRLEPPVEYRLMRVDDIQPSTTLVVDLKQDEEKLLSQMKSKTRYNVRLSERKGVEFKRVEADRLDDFFRLMEQTTHRDNFRAHPEVYYRTMLEVLHNGEVDAFLAMAFYEDRPIASNVMIDFDGVRTYLHGATSNLHRNVMAQYGMHWHLIQEARQLGYKAFDFWGIAPENADFSHAWTGITRYKKGFGGKVLAAPGTYDLPLKHLWYSTYSFIRGARRTSFTRH
ncbi:MAG: peptidoglycan bridge formation glycyltransferase FemA/FemB family protein [Patescibacteria group bacterium]